jgi:hypothetical protein
MAFVFIIVLNGLRVELEIFCLQIHNLDVFLLTGFS